MRTEDQLTGALREAAQHAPAPDLLAGVGERRRRRTRRRAQALAVLSVVAVVGVSTAVAKGVLSTGGGNDVASPVTSASQPPTPTPTLSSTDEPSEVTFTATRTDSTPIEKLWPKAVFTMPAKNAQGWRYRPITGISATEVLLNAESSFEKSGRIEIYDTTTGQFRTVTEVPSTPGLKDYYPQSTDLDDQNVVWYANAKQSDGTPVVEFWKYPRAGGTAERFGTLTGDPAKDVEAFALDGDRVVWSRSSGGVYSMPLAGGDPQPVAGGEGLYLADWPWASDVGGYGEAAERAQTKVVNLQTGEVREIKKPVDATSVRCGAVWCTGRIPDGTFVQHVDGTRYSQLPNAVAMGGLSDYPILNRFISTGGNSIYDFETGTLATYDNRNDWSGEGTSSEPSTIVYWGATKGDKPDMYRMINLAAVPPEQ